MATQATKLAVLGLGTMGQGMVSSALRAGIPTVVWDRNIEVARRVVASGAEVATTPTEAVQAVDVAITMVTDANAVTSIATDLGMLDALPPRGGVGADEHDRRRGDRGNRRNRRAAEAGRRVSRRTRIGQQGPSRTGSPDDLRLGGERGASQGRAGLRSARATHDMARAGGGGGRG